MRECWVLEEYSAGEGWYPVRAAERRHIVDREHARWPDTLDNPKRIVRYVPAPPQEETPA